MHGLASAYSSLQVLKRFIMNVTGSSDTKWFGQAVYEVEGYIILHSGCPGEFQTAKRNEGAGIYSVLFLRVRAA